MRKEGSQNPHIEAFRELAKGIGWRSREAARYKREKRKESDLEQWSFGYGEYGPEVEQYLLRQLGRIAFVKQSRGDYSPVIALDFGGMYGFSFLRLATAKRAEIENSQLALVVTNLQFQIDQGLQKVEESPDEFGWVYEHRNSNNKDLSELIRGNKGLVHYIQADAAELQSKNIILPNNTETRLQGNIDVVYEAMTLQHGWKNDVDLPLLGKALSQYGVLYIGSKYLHSIPGEGLEGRIIREKAHKIGENNLLKLGLKKVEIGERMKGGNDDINIYACDHVYTRDESLLDF